MERPLITLSMIVKNEQDHIARCLASVRGVVDEIVVVDTGSTDNTKTISEAAGAKVFSFEWTDDFSAARNRSISEATGAWVLVLDADEELAPESGQILKAFALTAAPDVKLGSLTVEDTAYRNSFTSFRMFRGGYGIFYVRPVHEQLSVVDKLPDERYDTAYTEARIVHHGYVLAPDELRSKLERNRILLEKHVRTDPDDAQSKYYISEILAFEGKDEEALAYLPELIEIGQNDPSLSMDALLLAVSILGRRQQFQEIIGLLQRKNDRFADNPELLFSYGAALAATGDIAGATKMFEECLQNDLTHARIGRLSLDLPVRVKRSLAVLRAQSGDGAGAGALAEELLRIDQDDVMAQYLIEKLNNAEQE